MTRKELFVYVRGAAFWTWFIYLHVRAAVEIMLGFARAVKIIY